MSFSDTKRDATNDTVEMQTYPIVDPGIYRARLETIDSKELKFGETLIFNWKIIGGDCDGQTFSGLASKVLMPKSKLATWAKAHLNITTFPPDFVLSLSTLVGKEIYATLTVEPRKDGGGDVNVVQAVSPYKPATKKPKPAAAKPADNGFNDAFEEEIPDPGEPLRAKEQRVDA